MITCIIRYRIDPFGRDDFAGSGRASTGRTLRPASRGMAALSIGLFAAITALGILPHLGVLLLSLSILLLHLLGNIRIKLC